MEGLLLAEAVRPLEGRLPLDRGPWRFPDERTAVLPLLGPGSGTGEALWIFSRPPSPWLALRPGGAAELASSKGAPARTSFQEQLAARAVGRLEAVRQRGLDRVVELAFGAAGGFVPHAPVTLVVELTGRNANLVLLDPQRTILGVERVILEERNRYRELKPGIPYRPPPPYDKLDPREAGADALTRTLEGQRLSRVRSVLDGVGPQLTAALAAGCDLQPDTRLEGDALARVVDAVRELAASPAAWLERAGGVPDLQAQRRSDRRQRDVRQLESACRHRLEVTGKRLQDIDRALSRAEEAGRLREEADLLMAYPQKAPQGAARARLTGFDGHLRTLDLDPRQDAFGNARKRYDRARRLERRAERARRERPTAEAELRAAEEALAGVHELDDAALRERAAALTSAGQRHARPAGPGVRFAGPHGFEVVVGRNARENDAVTFRVARSRDLWLHVQGFTGAHVVVRSGGKEVPFDTVLFAARLAAGFSPARHSDNVAVDYTLRKNVWKVKGQPPGAVRFSQQKTVYVTPARDDAAAAGEKEASAGDGGERR